MSAGAGIELLCKSGERVSRGDEIAVLHSDEESRLDLVEDSVRAAFHMVQEDVEPRGGVLESIRAYPDGWGD